MLTPSVPQFRKRHKPRKAPPAPAPVALTLVSALFDENVNQLFLVFDRAVDASGFDGTQVSVNDPVFNGGTFEGVVPANVDSPTTLVIDLELIGPGSGVAVTLSATALSGIVAVDDGGTWAGVTDVGLPFDG